MNSRKDEEKEQETVRNDPSCRPQDESVEEQSASCGCEDSPCCGSSRLTPTAKTIVFAIVILMAIAVAAWSFLKKNTSEGVGQTDKQSERDKALQRLCGITLDSLSSLNDVAADKDFVFILLPGVNAEDSKNTARVVEQTSETLSRKGIRVGTFTIKRDNPDNKKAVSSLGLEGAPAVLLMGKGCATKVVTGEITEDKLLKGYVLASTPSSCYPDSGGADSCR